MSEQNEVKTWDHSRKGEIVGKIVSDTGEWVTILCTEPNRHAGAGETLICRKAFLVERAS